MDEARIQKDAQLAAAVHAAEARLNEAIHEAAEQMLDAEASVRDISVIGRGRCVVVNVSVRRRI